MLIICDTHALVFWADAPEQLGAQATSLISRAAFTGDIACSDISLWEIAMLHAKGRLNTPPGRTISDYIDDIVLALGLQVLPITPQIAERAQAAAFVHGDPADRIIGATVLEHRGVLVSKDQKLTVAGRVMGFGVVW